MDFLRAGEALIRSSQPLLLPFLTPTAHTTSARVGALSRNYRPQQWQCQNTHRAFSCSSHRRQQAGAVAKEQDFAGQSPSSPASDQQDTISAIFDRAIEGDKNASGAPPSRSYRQPQRGLNPLNDRRLKPSPKDSVDQILQDMTDPSSRDRTASSRSASSIQMDVAGIIGAPTPWRSTDLAPAVKAAEGKNEAAPMKLGSTTGRVIQVNADRGIDAARAFRMLGTRLAQNNVRRDFQRQRFHERPGLKRKRLKSERWRKRFKEAFQGTVSRVLGLKRQGW